MLDKQISTSYEEVRRRAMVAFQLFLLLLSVGLLVYLLISIVWPERF